MPGRSPRRGVLAQLFELCDKANAIVAAVEGVREPIEGNREDLRAVAPDRSTLRPLGFCRRGQRREVSADGVNRADREKRARRLVGPSTRATVARKGIQASSGSPTRYTESTVVQREYNQQEKAGAKLRGVKGGRID